MKHRLNSAANSYRGKPAVPKSRGHVFTILTLVAGLAVSRGSLLAATFSKPVALATDDLAGYRVSSAIDANADAIALWSGQYSFWPAGAAWSAAESFGGTGSPIQTVHMTATGAATAVWVALTTDVMTADLPLDGTWSTPLVLATGTTVPAPIFVMDSKGDADVVFLDNGEAVAYRRAAGASSWGAREIVTTAPAGYDLQLSGAAMGKAGDFAFAWQTFQVICSRFCHEVNFVVHVSREKLAGSTWQDSGALT